MAKTWNPLDQKQLSRLQESIEWSNRQLAFPRQKRVEAIRQHVGFHYMEGGSGTRMPVNSSALAVMVFVRLLAARAPRVLMSTRHASLKPTAASFELALNELSGDIGLSLTLRRVVTEALFSIGIVRCGLHRVGTVIGRNYGKPFADIVTIDDYFVDMSAKEYGRISYEGNDYWLNYGELMDSGWLTKKEKGNLQPDEYTVSGPAGEERAESVSNDSTPATFRDKIWLRDIWLPEEKLVVTTTVRDKKFIKEAKLDRLDHSPYYRLGFSEVPGQLLPFPPIAMLRDLNELSNDIFRKLADQADAQKTVQGFQGGDDETVEDFKKARDGDGIRFSGAKPEKLTAGGVDTNTLMFYLQCRDLFSYFANNLDSLGGLSTQSETVGQDRLLSEASGAQMRDMADRTIDFTKELFKALAYYEWHDPLSNRSLQTEIPGIDLTIPVEWNRDAKQGRFDSYDLDIDVHSLQDNSPAIKLQKLRMFLTEFVGPLQPMIQAVGGVVDVEEILRLAAKYADFQEAADIVTFMSGNVPQAPEGPAQPANTTRTYERVGRSGQTREGATAAMQQLLMGANPAGSEVQGAMG